MSMDMASTTSSMAMSMTGTAAPAATSMDMSDMDMGMGGCKINMLWNWYTIDACFLTSSWRITSSGMFAGCCIGVICLVIALESLRRLGKEYDRFLLRSQQRCFAVSSATTSAARSQSDVGNNKGANAAVEARPAASIPANFRPNVLQQGVRALLHMLQFAVAYFIMLLAMYYNGYFIICIFIGAYLGFFIFGWETVSLGAPQEDVTVCCG